MLKRMLSIISIIAVMSAFLITPAFADTINMKDVIAEELLPTGFLSYYYVSPVEGRQSSVVLYIRSRDEFFHVSFNGQLTLNDYYGFYTFSFTQPDSLFVRVYEARGRDLHQYIDNQTLTVSLPSSSIDWQIKTSTDTSGMVHWEDWDLEYKTWPDRWDVSYHSDGRIKDIRPSTTWTGGDGTNWFSHSTGATVNVASGTYGTIKGDVPASSFDISISDFNISNIDYYVVQRQGSGISSNIDYLSTFSYVNDMLTIDGLQLFGNLVSARFSSPNTTFFNSTIRFDTQSYYNGISTDYNHFLHYDQWLNKNNNSRLPLSIYNRYLAHFGYPLVEYSQDANEVEQGLDDIQSDMEDTFGQADNIGSQAEQSITDISNELVAVQPLMSVVWDSMPFWLWFAVGFYLSFLVLRKLVGR